MCFFLFPAVALILSGGLIHDTVQNQIRHPIPRPPVENEARKTFPLFTTKIKKIISIQLQKCNISCIYLIKTINL